MGDKNSLKDAIPGRAYPTLPAPDVMAAIEQFADLANTIVPAKLLDDDMIPVSGTWRGYPAWFRKRAGVLEVHMNIGAGGDGPSESGWKVANPVAPVPSQRKYQRATEVNALRQAMVRAAIALHNEWEPHLLTLEGGPALNPSAFLSLMQATADYREATGE